MGSNYSSWVHKFHYYKKHCKKKNTEERFRRGQFFLWHWNSNLLLRGLMVEEMVSWSVRVISRLTTYWSMLVYYIQAQIKDVSGKWHLHCFVPFHSFLGLELQVGKLFHVVQSNHSVVLFSVYFALTLCKREVFFANKQQITYCET